MSIRGQQKHIHIAVIDMSLVDWARYEATSLFAVSEFERCPNPISKGGRVAPLV